MRDNSLMADNQYLLATTPANEQLMEVLSFYTPPSSKLLVFASRAFLKDNTTDATSIVGASVTAITCVYILCAISVYYSIDYDSY